MRIELDWKKVATVVLVTFGIVVAGGGNSKLS